MQIIVVELLMIDPRVERMLRSNGDFLPEILPLTSRNFHLHNLTRVSTSLAAYEGGSLGKNACREYI